MAISNKIKQLYDAIKSDGGDVGTEDEFNDWFLRPGEEGYNNRKRVYDTFKSDGADVGANYEEFRDWLGLRPADAGAAASTAALSAPTQQQPSALPGVVSRDIDAPMEIERRDIIADAIDENERLQKDEMAKKAADIDAGRGWDDTKGVWDNFVRIVGGGANESVGSAAPKANVTEHDENMRNLVAERQVLEETRKRRDAGRLKKSEGVLNGTFDLKNNARNIGKGVTDVVTDADFLLNGVIGMQKGDQLIKIDEKIGRGEELTDSELRLVNAALLQGKVESETTVPHGYTAGQTLAEMAPFMAQMALNPANGAASTMAKAAAKQSIKRFGKKAARRIATGVTIAGEVGESAVLANTLQATSTASDIKSRYIGKAYVDENGQIAFDGSKDWSDAIYRGEGAAIIENYTELLGSHFGLMKDGAGELVKTGVTKLGGGKLVNQVSDLVTRIGSTKWAQAIGNIEKRANWNGSIGEMLEEEAGIVLNSMFVGDNKISDLVDPEQQIDIALGVGLFGGFVSGIKTAGYPVARYNARRNLNRADVRASELMGDEWDGLRDLIDDAEEGDLSSIVASVIAEEGTTEQKQRAVVDYARALMTSRGYNISSESVKEDGMASAEEVGAEDSFDAGYSITDSQEMVDARLEMERQRMKLVSSMSEDIADEFDADPLDALARTYDPEIREIASKYVNAKMVYDGMIQRVRDDIDGRIAQSDAMIDGRVNRDTGMIQGATLTDGKEVYVVNGNVAMLDDGVNVDVENSDESLIVRDAEGRLEFVAPSQVQSLLAPVDAASEKEAAAEAIRNEIAQSAADKIDGVLHFAPNDVYAVINEDGTQESLTIVGESVDASGVAVDGMVDVMREDGSVVAMNTADIQRMVDESNARRLDERDKARESAEADSGVEAAGAAAEEPRPSALSRIPTDQNGEPLYEQVDADTAWDAFVEQSEGDEEIAKEVVADIVAEKRKELADAEKALKSIGDSKPNASNGEGALTIQERIAAKMASKRALTDARDAVERAKGVVEHWQSIGDIVKRRAEAEAAERRRQAEIAAEEARQAAERERAEAEESRLSDVSEAEDVRYRIREDEPPTKTGIGYKVFVLKEGKLYPPMVANPNGEATPVGVWLDADAAPIAGLSKTGRQQVKAGGKGTQGGSGKLAYRPGWHLGVIPYALQFNRKDESTGERELFPKNFVWAEVEYADDVDYQEEAMSYGYNSNGKFQHSYAGLPRLPLNGSYKYRTNPNPETDPWIITGAMKVNRLLTPTEVDSMVEAAGREPQRRQEGAVTDADIERLNDELTAERERSGDGSYSDAEVSMENDPWSKAWGETLRSKREQRAFAQRERERMRAKAVELSERLGVDIEIIEDNSSLEGKRGRSKGWYGVKDGKISVVLGNHVSVADIEKTVLHEAVAHHGLRELLGEHFDEFLDKVYELADNSIKERIALLASRNGWNRRIATEEYLAGLAEDTDFENAKAYNGWWGKIKRLFLDMLSAVGFKRTGVELSDNELRYILWRSYKNMVEPGRFRVFEWEAEDVAMKYNLKAGEYAESSPVTEQRVAEAGELYELNDRFNNELNRQIAGDLPQGHVYDMGMPSEYLLSTGIARLPIRLSAKILNTKSNLERHAYDLETLRNLVYAIQKPWAIFSYGDRSKAQNMIIGIEDNGRQFLVGISINPTIKGRVLEINSIRNVFPKNNHEWVNWINEGKLLRVDGKKEIQDIIAKLRMNPVAFDYVDLDNAAKIVENFKNPTIREQNNNAGESVDDGVRYRMGDFTPRDRKIAADVYDKMVSSARFEFSEAMQDSMLGLKKLYEAIKGKKGFRIEEVEGYENAYIYENRMSSTNGNEQHLYFIRKMKPLLKAISDICGNSGSERRILTDYMIAKHGLERNVILAERDAREAASKGADYNDELAKCRQRDYSGLTALTGEKDLATAERVAQQMVDDYERDTDTTELWSRVKSATEATLEKMYTSGLMSEERFNQVRGMFQHYIPLRGWDETTSNEVYTYLLQDDHATGTSLTKKAGGRSSKADDPIANIAAMADSAISQGNRNIMKQRFLNFVLNNPSDLVSHNELWLEHDAVNDEWRPVFAELDAADTPADVAKKIEAFEARMKSLQAQHPDKYKRGSEAVNIPYKVVGNNLREHQVLVRRNGVTTVLTINGNPRAAQALNGLTNPDVKAGSHYDEALSMVMYVNRQLSALYTTRNPDFVVSNFIRDMLYSNCMTWIKETPSYALRYHRNFGKFNPAIMTRLLNKYENGTLNSNDYIEHAFEQFMANGGETGFTNLKDIEGHKRAIAKELRRQGNVALRSWSALGMKLDLMNRSVENCARFAAYVTSREMGRSVDRSIYDAKEISVNFNKKGSGGTMAQKNRTLLGKIGAHTSGWGRLLYVFWNAGIQGMTNYGRAAKRNPAKATAAATALFSLGWVIPLLAQAGGGDDDDKNAYYNLPSYIRRSNICFSAGDQWVTIPLPIEYRAIYGLGELAYGAISGNERYSDDELCHEVMAQFSQLLPIDMLEGGGGLSPFIPSLAKPAVEAYVMNKSWTGLPIYKDTGYNKDDPEWTKAYKNADQHLVKASRWLNEVSGGDDFKKGRIDIINPAKVEYLLNGMFGGMVSFPSKVVKTVETIGGSREFEWRNIPLANRIIKSGDERTANRRLKSDYYKYKKEAMDAMRLARKYESRGQEGFMEYAEKADFLYNSPEYRRALVFTNYEPDIKALEQSIDDAGDPNVRKMLETDLYSTMREMVNELEGIAQE